MSLLSIIQSHCRLHALSVPTSVVGSTDTQAIQLLEVIRDVMEDLVTQSKFQVTTVEAQFSCTPSVDQGDINDLAPSGFQYIVPETFFDRTQMRALTGPLTETEWQAVQALPSDGVFYKWRLMGNRLLLYPAPTAPFHDLAFEYMSSWYVKDANGTLLADIASDTDEFLFPEDIIKKGLMYRWKQIKGLPYQADEKAFWDKVNNYIVRNKTPRRINVSEGTPQDVKPGVIVPLNSWNL